MTDVVFHYCPRLLSANVGRFGEALASNPDTAESAASAVTLSDLLPVHLDTAGFLASILTGSQDGPAFPFLRHLGLPHILAWFGYESEWSADEAISGAVSPAYAGMPSLAASPGEALRSMLTGKGPKRCLLLFSADLEPADVVRSVTASARAGKVCMVFVGSPGALLEPSLGDRAHHLALRFPAVLVFPGRLRSRRVEVPLSAMDLLPTLLETIGLPPFLRKDAPPIAGRSHFESFLTGSPVIPGPHHAWFPGGSVRVSQRGPEKLVIDGRGPRLHLLDRDPDEATDALGRNREIWTELADSLLEVEDRLAIRR